MNTILNHVENGIATITFNRPEVRNAISLGMVDELHTVLDEYKNDPAVKVIVFTGAGNAFISGGDLEQFLAVRGEEQAHPLLHKAARLLTEIDQYPKPTIAMINGAAIGGGCEFATSCTFRYASERAKIGFVQVTMHITTGWGGGSRLLAKLSDSQALSLLLTGERLTASKALELGFIDHVSSEDALSGDVYEFAGKIARQPLESIEAYMRLVQWKKQGVPYQERIEREVRQCAQMWGTEQHVGVVNQFLEKK
ncbi:enoyl-CoA hydratase/isomerase family protein [Brevibacillus dissolubilis]|uniref:enoyl-CoA hydratase/isomerase family protein n=1 Tax=Brevibacillus dissolubilis TaxID=1844116 RepID=UPI0011171804|nr:enoyl-CoA hydratase/isomerase family protein [Brevibacillus dissolubilis]